jgi:hypothetical protein
MVQGLYAENLRHLANYGIPRSGDRQSFQISALLNWGMIRPYPETSHPALTRVRARSMLHT